MEFLISQAIANFLDPVKIINVFQQIILTLKIKNLQHVHQALILKEEMIKF